ncbi:SIR2 family protein [Paenibacillus polymyxa]|uniref:SIR2 family protein n=1 Tax=Paenibacillus polymyxa TaxID=1406 RepID=UPI00040711C4|nr:SIR2 family protein [Paenibacillus polymyxa]
MLLDTLVDTEITKFIETRDIKYIKNIERYTDIIKEQTITERFLRSLGFTLDETAFFLSQLKVDDIVEEKIHLTCIAYEEDSTITLTTSICPVCNQTIREDDHELEPIYEIQIKAEDYATFKQGISDKLLNIFLNREYSNNYKTMVDNIPKIVPLVGAGFSVPLGAPSWEKLFLKFKDSISEDFHSTYEVVVKSGDYFKGIPLLYTLSKSVKTDEQLKVKAAQIIEGDIDYNISSEAHNYSDLLKVKFPYYLTTNYDNALNVFNSKFSVPLELEDIDDVQNFVFVNKFRVIHLHGILDKPNSLVLTKEDYDKKYTNDGFSKKVLALMVHKSLLFLGFSFSDVYFENLYNYVQKNVGGTHFIITTNAARADELIKFNIIPIVLKINNDTEIILALRYLLKNLEMKNHV